MKYANATATLWALAGVMACMTAGCTSQDGDAAAQPTTADTATKANKQSAIASKKRAANHLAGETSPYLLLHAHNPVDWYPWSPEAFAKAHKEQKPIFLSVGYSSCYWCHVMERLVFENEKIAALMNEHFVCIKVDREERPDIDDIYMTSLYVYMAAIGSQQGGGWPLSMFLTPDGKPFAGGTYFPPEDDHGRLGFGTVLKRIAQLWKDERKQVEENAEIITGQVRRAMKSRPALTPIEIGRPLVKEVSQAVAATFDAEYGGVDFNPARPNGPKFPVPGKLALLQYESRRGGDKQAGKIVRDTLDRLIDGGIHDHLGGGFHRYSTDRYWHVPHFEKMLYDQAQLADVFVEAYRQTGEPKYRETAEDIFRYVAREMTDPAGAFYSALDAETDGVEGAFYVWSKQEVKKILGGDDTELFGLVYGLEQPQTFEHGYVLRLVESVTDVAGETNIPSKELSRRLATMRSKLLAVRSKREPLLKDDKTLTSWNGMMIRAYAHAGMVFGEKKHIASAEKAALFVLSKMRDDRKRLRRTYRNGKAKLNAYLDDYAMLVEGLLALHEATGDQKWQNAAQRLTDQQIELFWDERDKGFFFTAEDHEELIVRTKNANDGAVPSGNGVSIRNLIRLASLTGEEKYRRYAKETIDVFAPAMERSPRGMVTVALALGEFLDDPDFAAGLKKPQPTIQPDSGKLKPNPPATKPTDTPQEASRGFRPITPTAGEPPSKKPNPPALVTTRAFLSLDKLPAGGTCRLVVFVDIKKDWHINANPPNPDFLIPTLLSIKSKLGCKLIQVEYPAGKQIVIPGTPPLHVYEKQAVISGVLEVPESAVGKVDEIEILVRYQPCNEQQCLPPKTAKLIGRVSVAGSGEAVSPVNLKLFPKPGSGK